MAAASTSRSGAAAGGPVKLTLGKTPQESASAAAASASAASAPVVQASGTVRQRVQEVIDLIRPAVQADGGDIELVDVDREGVVHVRFHGACNGCPSSTMTLHMGIERNLRDRVPEVTQVVPVP